MIEEKGFGFIEESQEMAHVGSSRRHRSAWNVVPAAIVGSIILALVLAVMLGLSAETGRRFRSIEEGWHEYSHNADPRGIWISQIRGFFGYGGMIHNFKNYVLRKDPVYETALRIQTANLMQAIDSYLAADPDPVEKDALLKIRKVVEEYSRNISKITDDIAKGKNAEEIDADVRVDDSEALAALATLELHWAEQRQKNLAEIVGALSEGENLVRSQGWIMAGLTALVVIIAGLIYALMGSALRAQAVQLRELKARKTAQEEQRKLTWAIEQSPASIMITDTSGKIEFVNRKFFDLTGYTREEVIGHNPGFLKSGHTPESVYREIWDRLASGRPWRGVFRNLRKDGSAYWAATQLLPLLDESGKITNYIGIGEDITEKRHMDEQIAQVQKMEAVGILAGSVAHDFNNVLMTIIGNTELIKLEAEDMKATEDLLISVNHIELASKRARALIQQLLTFARQQPGRPRRLNLHNAITEAMELIEVSIPPTIKVVYRHIAEDLACEMDPTAFFQIIMNLCQNAAEAMADKGGEIVLDLQALPRNHPDGLEKLPKGAIGTLQLCVRDTGPGIPQKIAEQIFNPFFSTKPVGKGTGLGLAIVRNWMEEAHGQVSLSSLPGQGSCFTLLFAQYPDVASHESREVGPVRGHEHILLVDDEEGLLYTIRRMLARLGYQVEAYTDPTLALRAFQADPDSYDAVVTDFMMPNLSGIELIEAMRSMRKDFPAMLLSSYLGKGDIPAVTPRIVRAAKPIDLAVLASTLRETIENKDKTEPDQA